jgi:hypothetical protein
MKTHMAGRRGSKHTGGIQNTGCFVPAIIMLALVLGISTALAFTTKDVASIHRGNKERTQ